MRQNYCKILFVFITLIFITNQTSNLFAQGEHNTIQLSGIVVDGEEDLGIPGVSVYIKEANRGVATNKVGFFSMPVVIGDTIVVRAVGYKEQHLVIPRNEDLGMTILIDLQSDTTLLPVIEIFPYPTKELFEEAFMALGEHRDERLVNMERNLNEQAIQKMARMLPMGASGNHRNFINQQIDRENQKYSAAPAISLFNPFAWAEFIRSLKNGDFKKKE